MIRSIYRALALLNFGLISHAFVLGFSEDSQQCGSVRMAWGQRADAAEQFQYPFYLYIVPFNSTAIIQKIDNWTASTPFGSALLDFPLPASTSYILGVVDSQGQGVGASSQVLVAQNSTNTSCLLPQRRQRYQFVTILTDQPSGCPAIALSFDPLDQPLRALSFSPGERPLNIIGTSTAFRSGLVRVSGLTSLSRLAVVYQPNDNSPAYTSSLMTVGGTDSVECGGGADHFGASSIPDALKGGSVIGYSFAAVFVTALVTTSFIYVYNLRVESSRPPCPPPKERSFLLTRRRPTSIRDVDLEAACYIPLPPSTGSLISLPLVTAKRESIASLAVPGPPQSTPISPRASISGGNHTEETVRPTVQDQSNELEPAVMLSPTNNPHHYHTSPSVYSVNTKHSSHGAPPKRQSDASTTYPQSTRPSTFVSGIRESVTPEPFAEMMASRFTPRPDSPTLPEVPTASPFHFSFTDFQRSSKGSSKKSEKRSMYLKMDDVEEEEGESSQGVVMRRRARSLTRTRSSTSNRSKKARSVPR